MTGNWPWIAGAIAALIFFAVFEVLAFAHPDRLNTLSHAIASLGARWPFSIFLCGMFVGVLAAHLFWPWSSSPLGPGGG
jgi:hypothetical protein